MGPLQVPVSKPITNLKPNGVIETRFVIGNSGRTRVNTFGKEKPKADSKVWSVHRDRKLVETGLRQKEAILRARELELKDTIDFEVDRLATQKQVSTQFLQSLVDQPGFIRGPISRNVFLFSRFMVKQIELGLDRVRQKDYPGAFRFFAANAAIGGLSRAIGIVMLLRALPYAKRLIPADMPARIDKELRELDIGEVLIEGMIEGTRALMPGAVTIPGFIPPETYKAIASEIDQRTADMIMFGLPSLMGWDLSKSATILDVPFGATVKEMLANKMLGVTGQIVTAISGAAGSTKGVEPRKSRRVFDAAARKMPPLRLITGFERIANKDYNFRDPTGRLNFRGDLQDVFSDMAGFRSLDLAKRDLVLDTYKDIFTDRDKVIAEAARFAAAADRAKTPKEAAKWEAKIDEIVYEWNEFTYPEHPIDPGEVFDATVRRMEDAEKPLEERIFRRNIEKAIVEEALER
jgi:hypothetical protein